MTYHCGIGPGMASIGFTPRSPQITCDAPGCTAVYILREDRVPPQWFMDGKPPPRWRQVREGDTRRDYCPEHKEHADAR